MISIVKIVFLHKTGLASLTTFSCVWSIIFIPVFKSFIRRWYCFSVSMQSRSQPLSSCLSSIINVHVPKRLESRSAHLLMWSRNKNYNKQDVSLRDSGKYFSSMSRGKICKKRKKLSTTHFLTSNLWIRLENSSREENTRPSYLPPEKSVWR